MTRNELNALSKTKLTKIADDLGIDVSGLRKSEVVDLIASVQVAPVEEVSVEESPVEVAPARKPIKVEDVRAAVEILRASDPSPQPAKDEFYKVGKACRYAVDGFCHTLPAGMIVSSKTHNIQLMLSQKVLLVSMDSPTEKELHTAPGRLGQLRALTGAAPESAMDAYGGEAASYYQLGPDGERLPLEPIAVSAAISIAATLK